MRIVVKKRVLNMCEGLRRGGKEWEEVRRGGTTCVNLGAFVSELA